MMVEVGGSHPDFLLTTFFPPLSYILFKNNLIPLLTALATSVGWHALQAKLLGLVRFTVRERFIDCEVASTHGHVFIIHCDNYS